MSRRPHPPTEDENNDDRDFHDNPNAEDQDLINAFTKGDLISIGPAKGQSNTVSPEVSAAEFEIPYFLYNNPIGIDFSKALSPVLFLLSGHLLNQLSETPFVSQEYRYIVENLKNELFLGKIAEFIHSLDETIKKNIPKGITFQATMDPIILQAFINIKAFILNIQMTSIKGTKNTTDSNQTDSFADPKWLSSDQLMDYVNHPAEMKTKIKEFRSICELTANRFSLSFYLRILLDQVIGHLPPEEKAEYWLNLRHNLNQEDLATFRTNLEPRITHRIILTDEKPVASTKGKEKTAKAAPSAPNDPLFWDFILLLNFMFQNLGKSLSAK